MKHIHCLSKLSPTYGIHKKIRLVVKRLTMLTSCLFFSQLANAAQCNYIVVDEWDAAFKAEVSIVNNAQAITDWQLSWSLNPAHSIQDSWEAKVQCTAGECVATPTDWFNQIESNNTLTFGFIANKNGQAANANVTVNGAICDETNDNDSDGETSGDNSPAITWSLDGDSSSMHYVSMKKDHTAEINTFIAPAGSASSLLGTIDNNGNAILSINLNHVSTGVETRNNRLLSLLFETEFLPKAYITTNIDMTQLEQMNVGDTSTQTLNGELALHGVSQAVSAKVLVIKKSETQITVSTLEPLLIDSKSFDMAGGIEALRQVANLSTVGEVVPVYFHLNYQLNSDQALSATDMPAQVNAPTELGGSFDIDNMQANLSWTDNSNNETLFLVRRKIIDGYWATIAELSANSSALIEGLPEAGEFDYKIIALNNGRPSLPSNIQRVTVTEGNQLVRGQQIFKGQCAGCHGLEGQGIGSFPALNTERDVASMVNYIRDFMPQAAPASCDQQCAEDAATFIQTLWVTEMACDISATPVTYGARQLKILTQIEYQNSLEDLLGIDFNAAQGLSADSKIGFFVNNTYAGIAPSAYSNFLLVAEDVAAWSANRDFRPALSCSSFDQDCAEQLVDTLAPKIFRRPLTTEEISTYTNMANGSHTEGDVKQGLQFALEGLLSAPQFLYRHELGEANPDNSNIDSDAFELTSYEMATFLAYTYTGSTPDQALLEAASRDELRTESEIISHAKRLTSNAEGIMGDFVGSWLGTKDLALAAKDVDVWSGFSDLVPHMQQEINQTFAHIMLEPNEQFTSLYSANYSFLNQALAEHYGVDGVTGDAMQKVTTTDRGGILANGAFMARWGEGVETSPILRSVRVRRRMLCQDQPAPPAGTFAAREQKLAALSELLQNPSTTNRTKYHRLTEDSPCTNCHTQYINPLGFGMEDFDTVGRVRVNDLNGNVINALGELFAPVEYSKIDESLPFEGTQGLGTLLASLPSAQSCVSKQMFRYVMGVGHQEIDSANPEGTKLSGQEKSGYACAIEQLTNTMMDESPRAMFEGFGSLQAVRYRKAWTRETNAN